MLLVLIVEMVEELKNILEGKQTAIKSSSFFSAEAYIKPFITRMESMGAQFKCLAKAPEQLSITNGQPDVVYNKVHIQAILPTSYYNKDNWQKVVGFCYGLDCKTPIAKFYVGDIAPSGIICSFNPQAQQIQKIESETALDYTGINSLLEATDVNQTMLNQLKTVFYSREELQKKLGELIDYTMEGSYSNEGGKVKLSTTMPIDAYKRITKDKDSIFYLPDTEQISLYHLYTVFLDIIKNDEKDIINRFEKNILINRMLKIQ